jgi:hypothetical protein
MSVLPARDNGERRTDQVKRRRHTPDQIIRKLREAERTLAEGSELQAVAKALEVSSTPTRA